MLRETAHSSSHHGNPQAYPTGSEAEGDEKPTCVAHMSAQAHSGLCLHPAETFPSETDHIALDDGKEASKDLLSLANLSQDDTFFLEGCVQLERRWVLWHEFMKEHSCLDDWLRLAEKLAACPNSSHVLYITAKEELQKFEGLRAEASLRLAQLDSLGQRSRVLLGLFTGTMRRRLVEMTKECGQRWDQLSATVDSVCRRLKHFVLQREDFERQQEEVAVWLADMDLRLTEVEHFSERDTCAKMQQLQGFQQAVAESAGRLNALLQRGEALIQRSEPADAQVIEGQLQELLLYCGRVFQSLGRLHTRLLSMRLVFEDDWSLCPDSGCPSESVLEEEGLMECGTAPSAAPGTPLPLCHEHLVLEWDPMVDIGGSVSHDDTDSSYYNAGAGVHGTVELLAKDCLGRRGPLVPVAPQPVPTGACGQHPLTQKSLEGMAPPQTPQSELITRRKFSGVPHPVRWFVPADANGPQHASLWKTSTPGSHSHELVSFDPDRISAWLGQSHQLCSKGVQTECTSQCLKETPCSSGLVEGCNPTKICCAPSGQEHFVGPCRSWPLRPMRLMEVVGAPALLYILLALLLVIVILPPTVLQDNQCHRANTLARSFHLALRYVNGPPPT
ncbi:hypothetical protein P4O66_017766 [Electrophorus voltai]|uniref:KASH domain-containing protein n=1 Tax=Electrophorus voltai TaxID=2609070 RepID=A0AAD8YRP8_9TELE|nr:hypothetical protein P4O66_017766 [Electrophorus voltai]